MFVQVVQWRKWTWAMWASKEFIWTEIRSKMSLWDWVWRTKLWKNYSLSNNSVRTTPMRERRTMSNSSKSRIFLRLYRQFYRWVLTVKIKSNCFLSSVSNRVFPIVGFPVTLILLILRSSRDTFNSSRDWSSIFSSGISILNFLTTKSPHIKNSNYDQRDDPDNILWIFMHLEQSRSFMIGQNYPRSCKT